MAKTKVLEVSAEVETLFNSIETFVQNAAKSFPLKVQIEKDFRGKPVLSVRVRAQDVEAEMMKTLRYPE